MPEGTEIRSFAEYLRKHGWTIVQVNKMAYHARYEEAIVACKNELPLKINNVLSRGKELALCFDRGYMTLGMATGAAIYIGKLCELHDSPLDYRTNIVLSTEDESAIFIVDCHNTRNQVSFAWNLQVPFDMNRGPDLSDSQALFNNMNEYLTNEEYTKYFKRATIMDCLLNQSLFNGVGSYSANEISYWLWRATGIRPWANFKAEIFDSSLLRQFINMVVTFFDFMWNYVQNRPFIPPTKFCERQYLEFRAIFLKVYRQHEVLINKEKKQIMKFKISLTKAAQHDMCITKTSATCFVPGVGAENVPPNWNEKRVNGIGKHGLGVGPYAWWGQADKIITLNSPQKSNIKLRPSTQADLLSPKKRKREEDSEGEAFIPVKRQCTNSPGEPRQTLVSAMGRGSKRKGGRARKMIEFEKEMLKVFNV